MRKGEFQKAVKTFEKAEKKAETRGKIAALFFKGLAYFQRGDFNEAENAWEQCLERGCTIDQKIMVSHNLAAVYRLAGNLEKAQTLYQDLAATARFSEMEESRVKSLLGLANVLIDQCRWDKYPSENQFRVPVPSCPLPSGETPPLFTENDYTS